MDSYHFMYLYVGYLVDTFDVEHDSITAAGGEAVQFSSFLVMIQLSQLERHDACQMSVLRRIGMVLERKISFIFQKAPNVPLRTRMSVSLETTIDPKYLKFFTHSIRCPFNEILRSALCIHGYE